MLDSGDGFVLFFLYFILLIIKVNLILKKQSSKNYAFIICNINYLKIVLVLLIKIIILYMQVFIIDIKISGLKKFIIKYSTCFKIIMLLVLDK